MGWTGVEHRMISPKRRLVSRSSFQIPSSTSLTFRRRSMNKILLFKKSCCLAFHMGLPENLWFCSWKIWDFGNHPNYLKVHGWSYHIIWMIFLHSGTFQSCNIYIFLLCLGIQLNSKQFKPPFKKPANCSMGWIFNIFQSRLWSRHDGVPQELLKCRLVNMWAYDAIA